jgi:hypothetical protein
MEAMQAWAQIMQALQGSEAPEDKALAQHVARFVSETPYYKALMQHRQREEALPHKQRTSAVPSREVPKTRPSIDMER